MTVNLEKMNDDKSPSQFMITCASMQLIEKVHAKKNKWIGSNFQMVMMDIGDCIASSTNW